MIPWHKNAIAYYEWKFYSNNDEAHKLDHMHDVYNNMVMLKPRLENVLTKTLTISDNVMFFCAFLHDAYAGINRAEHHELGYNYVINGDRYINKYLTETEKELVGKAILYHRSSTETPTEYAEEPVLRLLRFADKGVPNYYKTLSRSIKYHIEEGTVIGSKHVYEHLKEKFGKNGYAWKKDELYTKVFKEEINVMVSKVEKMTLKEVETRFIELTLIK